MGQRMLHLQMPIDLMDAVAAEAARRTKDELRRVSLTEIVRHCIASSLGLRPTSTLSPTQNCNRLQRDRHL